MYMGARHYMGGIGRFLSVDPMFLDIGGDLSKYKKTTFELLSNPQELNSYSYALNNPVKNIDPSGNVVETIADVGFTLYDAGNFFYHEGQAVGALLNGNLAQADQHTANAMSSLFNVGVDAGSAFIPFLPAGLVRAENAGSFINKAADLSTGGGKALNVSKSEISAISKPYSRPSNATSKAQRDAVQGRPCVTCGKSAEKMYADHKVPLVKEYYQTGKIDKQNMLDLKSVQPQCPTCSNRQGGNLSNYSREMKSELGL